MRSSSSEIAGACTAGPLFIRRLHVNASFSALFFVAASEAKLRRPTILPLPRCVGFRQAHLNSNIGLSAGRGQPRSRPILGERPLADGAQAPPASGPSG